MAAHLRIGSGAGFSGDRLEPAVILAERGELDYLVLECLAERTIALAPRGLPLVAVDERTAVIRATDGTWSVHGAGSAVVFVDGRESGLDALPG